MYEEELVRRCSLGPKNPQAREFAGEGLRPEEEDKDGRKGRERMVDWKGFRTYLWEREAGSLFIPIFFFQFLLALWCSYLHWRIELWNAFHDLDRNHDGLLDVQEIQAASARAGSSPPPFHPASLIIVLTWKHVLCSRYIPHTSHYPRLCLFPVTWRTFEAGERGENARRDPMDRV